MQIQITRGGKDLFYAAAGFGASAILSVIYSGYYFWRMGPIAIMMIIALILATRPLKKEPKRRSRRK